MRVGGTEEVQGAANIICDPPNDFKDKGDDTLTTGSTKTRNPESGNGNGITETETETETDTESVKEGSKRSI